MISANPSGSRIDPAKILKSGFKTFCVFCAFLRLIFVHKSVNYFCSFMKDASYFKGSKKHKQYREKVQKYAKEEKRLVEDLHHGMILGAKTFVDKIRKQFLPDISHNDLPQQKQLAKDINIDDLLKKSAEIVQIDIDKCIQAKRLHGIDKHKRDLIVYFLWNKGLVTNEKLGLLFNVSYSAISHCVKSFKEKMNKDKKVKNQFEIFNSQFKL